MQLFYLRNGVVAGNTAQRHRLPFFTVSLDRFRELQREAPGKFHESEFRIAKMYGERFVDLEWV